ncbi:MAG: phosphopantothenate/pantothenate synthetase [Methanocalculus sp. MSAO_Arc2]|uniref:4-phosphopantoate--beta-alanine ligase n=1 Tax=Methanocalculus sp. MSAO_Arc2 TaxID=2293855 RepID=UPI000FEE865A|nr:MAG: phosphopantothenate/pantothenate synthetase [Methanocalculus sp. MSAO_Arc2]
MIPEDHPRYHSLSVRESLAKATKTGLVSPEGLAAHGRGEAFDYLLGEQTTKSASLAEQIAGRLLLSAERPVISVNGNAAVLAAEAIAELQDASGAAVEVNLFHRTEERVRLITDHLRDHGVDVLTGVYERLVPLAHDRGLCLAGGIGSADLVLVMLEDGDRCEALRKMGKIVIAIDLNPLSRTAKAATLPIVDELTRALPAVTAACRKERPGSLPELAAVIDNHKFLTDALREMRQRLV